MVLMKKNMLEVGCAIIERQGFLLIAQRHDADHLGGYWEFPGGKKEAGETLEECLVREVLEELGVIIKPRCKVREIVHTYPERDLHLVFWLCDWQSNEPQKIDCQNFCWILPAQLKEFKFPPADDELIEDLLANQGSYFLQVKSDLL